MVELKPLVLSPDSNLVERVTAPRAVWAAVNEPARMLVVGHGAGADRQLTLFTLDESGRATTSAPVAIQLPKPACLAAYTNVVVGMAVHPTQPLLYVLQDFYAAAPPPVGDPKTNQIFNEFDRLFVYRLDPTNTQLVVALRGERFLYAQAVGGYLIGTPLGVDTNNHRLYLPSLRDPSTTNELRGAIGYLDLDDQGLPVMHDGKADPPHLQASLGASPPTGIGWAPQGSNVVVFGTQTGIATWDMSNRRAPVTAKFCGVDNGGMLVGHPTLPIVYRTSSHSGRLYAIELVDGFPSLFPQELGFAYSYSPQFLTKRNLLAVGNANQVTLFRINPDGSLSPDASYVVVPDFVGTALCYAPGFDRLYVAVGKAP